MLHTRWYITRILRASRLPNSQKKGFVTGIWRYVPRRGRGQWMGSLSLPALGFDLAALTYEDSLIPLSAVNNDFDLLEQAPDNVIFDLRAGLNTEVSSWGGGRLSKIKTFLNKVSIDTARIPQNKKVLHVVREIARTVLLYQALGPNLPGVGLNKTVSSSMTPAFLDGLEDRLLELGLAQASIPPRSLSWKQYFRSILSNNFSNFGITTNLSLGHRNANLKDIP